MKKPTSLKQHLKEISQKGVAARRAKKTAAQVAPWRWPLRDATGDPRAIASPQDCESLTSSAAQALATGAIDWHKAHEISVLASTWLRAHDAGRAAEDVAAVKALLEELRDNKRGGPGAQVMRAKAREALARQRAQQTPPTEETEP